MATGPLITLNPPGWHPEHVTCWSDYLGLVNDVVLLMLVAGLIYLVAAEKVRKWRAK